MSSTTNNTNGCHETRASLLLFGGLLQADGLTVLGVHVLVMRYYIILDISPSK